MEDIVIVSAARTAVGKFGGSLAKTRPPSWARSSSRKPWPAPSWTRPRWARSSWARCWPRAPARTRPARRSIKSGVPKEVPALTINAVCGSGLKAVMLAAQAVAWGDSEIVVAGGQENMSASPHVLLNSRDGQRMGDWKMIDSMIVDGLWDVYNQYHMGMTAENVAKAHGISRDMQDALALASQQKAAAAQAAGKFKDEIVTVTLAQKKGDPILFNGRRVHQQEDQRRSPGRPAPGL
jgi:acetyl-CoA C-acetyltransferase